MKAKRPSSVVTEKLPLGGAAPSSQPSSPVDRVSPKPQPAAVDDDTKQKQIDVIGQPVAETGGFWASAVFSWVAPLISKGFRKPLEGSDLPRLHQRHHASGLVSRLDHELAVARRKRELVEERRAARAAGGKKETSEPAPRKLPSEIAGFQTPLWDATWRLTRAPMLWAGLCIFLGDALGYAGPLILGAVLRFVADEREALFLGEWFGYVGAVGLLVAAALQAIFLHQHHLIVIREGIHVRSAVTAAVFEKSMRMPTAAVALLTRGRISNMVATDSHRLMELWYFFHYSWSTPLEIAGVLALLGFFVLGRAVFAAGVVVLLVIPLQNVLVKAMRRTSSEASQATDRRVESNQEIVEHIRTVKLYAWERFFGARASELRRDELRLVRREAFLRAINGLMLELTPTACALVSFAFLTEYEGKELTPDVAFTALAFFNLLRAPLQQLPRVIQIFVNASVSLGRVNSYLEGDELPTLMPPPPGLRKGEVLVRHANFRWLPEDSEGPSGGDPGLSTAKNAVRSVTATTTAAGAGLGGPTPLAVGKPAITDLMLHIQPGDLAVCLGATGSGKSTLLAALLGEMYSSPSKSYEAEAMEGALCSYRPRPMTAGLGQGALVSPRVRCTQEDDGMVLQYATESGKWGEADDDGDLQQGDGKDKSSATSDTSDDLATRLTDGPDWHLLQHCAAFQGTVAYAPQTPWIVNGTVRQNVLMGRPLDPDRYAKVLAACALEDDLKLLPDGDETELGERGANLSGGQKQRVGLARAVYSVADVYVFDDPLSALDETTTEHVFAEAICGLLKGKTRLVVTHLVPLAERANRVILLGGRLGSQTNSPASRAEVPGGSPAVGDELTEDELQEAQLRRHGHSIRVEEEGTYQELVRRGRRFSELLSVRGRAAAGLAEEGGAAAAEADGRGVSKSPGRDARSTPAQSGPAFTPTPTFTSAPPSRAEQGPARPIGVRPTPPSGLAPARSASSYAAQSASEADCDFGPEAAAAAASPGVVPALTLPGPAASGSMGSTLTLAIPSLAPSPRSRRALAAARAARQLQTTCTLLPNTAVVELSSLVDSPSVGHIGPGQPDTTIPDVGSTWNLANAAGDSRSQQLHAPGASRSQQLHAPPSASRSQQLHAPGASRSQQLHMGKSPSASSSVSVGLGAAAAGQPGRDNSGFELGGGGLTPAPGEVADADGNNGICVAVVPPSVAPDEPAPRFRRDRSRSRRRTTSKSFELSMSAEWAGLGSRSAAPSVGDPDLSDREGGRAPQRPRLQLEVPSGPSRSPFSSPPLSPPVSPLDSAGGQGVIAAILGPAAADGQPQNSPKKRRSLGENGIELADVRLSTTSASATRSVADAAAGSSSMPARHTDQLRRMPTAALVKREGTGADVSTGRMACLYLSAMGAFVAVAIFMLLIGAQLAQLSTDVWLALWSDKAATTSSTYGLRVYAFLAGVAVLVSALDQTSATLAGLRASGRLFSRALSALLAAPIGFFDSTPAGRITSRLSRDTSVVDKELMFAAHEFVVKTIRVLVLLGLVSYVAFYFAGAMVPVFVIFWFTQRYYRRTSRQLKRLDNVSRSPVLSDFGEMLDGLGSVRAYGLQSERLQAFCEKIDANVTAFWHLNVANRWLGVRLDGLGAVVLFFATAACVALRSSLSAAFVGLAVTNAFYFTTTVNRVVREGIDTEVHLTSAERLDEYSHVSSELSVLAPAAGAGAAAGAGGELRPAGRLLPWRRHRRSAKISADDMSFPGWPQAGNLAFDHVSARYRPDVPLALSQVSFELQPGQRLGVVGRTGSGKSTLLAALFRVIEAETGQVLIDGVDLATVPLSVVRGRLGLVPQEPVVFSGSLRFNLDPAGRYTDEQLWQALAQVQLREPLEAQLATLDEPMRPGTLSRGQQQLLSIARVLLRRSRVVVMDEATSSMDWETDKIVSSTMSTAFRDSTVVIVAHRLETLQSCDKVLLMDAGRATKIGPPSVVLPGLREEHIK